MFLIKNSILRTFSHKCTVKCRFFRVFNINSHGNWKYNFRAFKIRKNLWLSVKFNSEFYQKFSFGKKIIWKLIKSLNIFWGSEKKYKIYK